jgi:hypothetical protein
VKNVQDLKLIENLKKTACLGRKFLRQSKFVLVLIPIHAAWENWQSKKNGRKM